MLTGLALWLLPPLLVPQENPGPTLLDQVVTVERVMVDARVIHRGRAVRGMSPESFRVRIDGEPSEVFSVTWVSAAGAEARGASSTAPGSSGHEPPVRGRLVVLFFQKDLHPTRTRGFLLLLQESRRLLSRFGPEDRVAILSFDTHLKLWRDFTDDTETLDEALSSDVIFKGRARYIEPGPDPSLAASLGLEDSRRAATPEAALRLIAEALAEIPGSKTLVFMGHGLGGQVGPNVSLHADYGSARRALVEADVTVFTLDVTDADRHTLEVGLQDIAWETGGFYARTHNFSRQAMGRIDEALAGHYVLEVAHPGGAPGRHEIDVGLVEGEGRVLARRAYFD